MSFLPAERHARRLALILLTFAPFAFSAMAVGLGQDSNWDLRNYHWYNAYAFLNERYGFDLLPSQIQFFLNPLLDVPFYLLATHVPAIAAGAVLGWVQGLNFILLFMFAHTLLRIARPIRKVAMCAALAALGMLSANSIAEIGTVFYDNILSFGPFVSALLVIRYRNALLLGPLRRSLGMAVIFSVPAGLVAGLKLPFLIFCIGLCAAFFFVRWPLRRRILIGIFFGIGAALGILITYGYWAWFLQTRYGNPFFPFFNNVFHSPFASAVSNRDTQFIPESLADFLFFPFVFSVDPYRVDDIYWRDWRIPILYAASVVMLTLRLLPRRTGRRSAFITDTDGARYLLLVAGFSYLAWLGMFCIYRYIVPLDMLAPLLIVCVADMFPWRLKSRGWLALVLLVVAAGSVWPGDWHRRASWSDRFIEAKIPPLGDTSDLMILMGGFWPYAHLATQFPPEIPFVRIDGYFAGPNESNGINDMIRARVTGHKGRFLMLIPLGQHDLAAEALRYFNLGYATQSCQIVTDVIINDTPTDLCPVIRLSSMKNGIR